MQAIDYHVSYGRFLHECSDYVIGTFKRRKLKLLAGETRYQRWVKEFDFCLLIEFRNPRSLAFIFREGPEESRAAAFEMLYLQSKYSQRVKLVKEAFESNSRYLRVRAAGLCQALGRDMLEAIPALKCYATNAVGVERIIALLHLNAIQMKYPTSDVRISDVDTSLQEQSILQQVSSLGWFWDLVVANEYELIAGMILLHDAKLSVTAGTSRLLDWCAQFRESCITAIKDKSITEELVGLTFGRAWIAAVELLVLSHHRDDPTPILYQLLGPCPAFLVCYSASGLAGLIYEKTSNEDALGFLDWLDIRHPPIVGYSYFSSAREQIIRETEI